MLLARGDTMSVVSWMILGGFVFVYSILSVIILWSVTRDVARHLWAGTALIRSASAWDEGADRLEGPRKFAPAHAPGLRN